MKEIVQRPFFYPLVILISLILLNDFYSLNFQTSDAIKPEFLNKKDFFEGVILEKPEVKKDKIKIPVRLNHGGVVLLTLLGEDSPYQKGDQLKFFAKLKEPTSYQNPGGFDYKKYLKRQGISATAFIESTDQIQIVKKSSPSFLQTKISSIKKEIKKKISFAPQPVRGVLLALLWGEESLLDSHTEDLFRNQGLTHLLVISGMHFGVIALIFFNSFIGCFKLYPLSFLYLPVRKIAALGTLIGLTLYLLFCNSSPSLFRGYIAVSFYLGALLLNRPRDLLNILFLAAFVILLLNPSDLFDLSFQFSFVAVLSLLFIFPRLKKIFTRKKSEEIKNLKPSFLKRLGILLLDLILVNITILIGLTPLMIFYFHEFPWSSLLMNLWGVPFIELLLVPLGLAGLFLQILFPPLASYLLTSTLWLIQGLFWVLEKSSHLLSPPLLIFPPHGWELVVYYLLLFVLVLNFSSKTKKIVSISLLSLLLGSFIWSGYFIYFSNDFKITQIDVGQGDSILVELPGAKRILIDGGGSPYFDIGENVLIPYLLYKRIPRLDAVVITHADSDHYLGLQKLIEHYEIGAIWWNGTPEDLEIYASLFEIAQKRNIPLIELTEGMTFSFRNKTIFTVLSPSLQEKKASKDNDQSVVLHLRSGLYTALFMADLEAIGENRLVQDYSFLFPVDYLKAGHHGSKTSSTLSFLKTIKPKIATIGVGKANRFHHPHPSVIKRFQDLQIPLYRTDLNGAIEIDFESSVTTKPLMAYPNFITSLHSNEK